MKTGRACILYLKGTTGSNVVVISPLVSLMMDQKAKFLTVVVSTEFVGEAQTDHDAIRCVTSELVFISPESRIENPQFRNMLLSQCY